MPKICLIEDEESLVELIKFNLELEGYSVNVFQNGQRAIDEIDEIIESDLVILDVMLPEVSGFDVCKSIRNHSQVPVLFLSAKGMAADRIHGLRLGANDYLPKPFDLEELILRVQNLIPSNDSTLNAAEVVVIGSKKIDFSTYEMTDSKTGNQHLFSKREIELLKLFFESKGQVISRDEILDRLWGKENFPTSRTIDNYILVFRKLFEENPRQPKYFHSIRGVGYKLTL
ncbi:MAG: response regulator transcription factor [Crocinitomicaceae bacterium]|jgi:two-component system alkaline phosphatase synthesis response regulator PhoP|tara:strand:+ start:17918 stop:18604 length:687 start_codon:yes stop_codon:yes gene_type:complete